VILGIGVDLADGERIRDRIAREGEDFLAEFLTVRERASLTGRRDPALSHAARFAAKEAFGKALGTGVIGAFSWKDVEVVPDQRGRPELHLSGAAERLARESGVGRVHVSLTHDGDMAAAVVVLEDA
jgi:holo-[acyl-carrier protein] synthase